jgi:ParB family chromosome partitioning protein
VAVLSVNPFRCRMWAFHDRLEEHVSEETCKDEIESFARRGQLVPALGRVLHDDPDHDVELIYGARRLFVARHLGMELQVDIRCIGDRDAIVAMDVENRLRRDISPYERGKSYLRWLASGHFSSQGELARSLRVSEAHVSRLLKVARLPAIVVNAFASSAEIREEWGVELARALLDNERRPAIIRAARRLAELPQRPATDTVIRQLLTNAPGRKLKLGRTRDEIVRSGGGAPLFKIRQHHCSVSVLLPAQHVDSGLLDRIVAAVSEILRD